MSAAAEDFEVFKRETERGRNPNLTTAEFQRRQAAIDETKEKIAAQKRDLEPHASSTDPRVVRFREEVAESEKINLQLENALLRERLGGQNADPPRDQRGAAKEKAGTETTVRAKTTVVFDEDGLELHINSRAIESKYDKTKDQSVVVRRLGDREVKSETLEDGICLKGEEALREHLARRILNNTRLHPGEKLASGTQEFTATPAYRIPRLFRLWTAQTELDQLEFGDNLSALVSSGSTDTMIDLRQELTALSAIFEHTYGPNFHGVFRFLIEKLWSAPAAYLGRYCQVAAELVVRKVLHALRNPYYVGGQQVPLTNREALLSLVEDTTEEIVLLTEIDRHLKLQIGADVRLPGFSAKRTMESAEAVGGNKRGKASPQEREKSLCLSHLTHTIKAQRTVNKGTAKKPNMVTTLCADCKKTARTCLFDHNLKNWSREDVLSAMENSSESFKNAKVDAIAKIKAAAPGVFAA